MHTVGKLLRCSIVLCPDCNGSMSLHGTYRRHCRDNSGKRHYGWVAQGYCATCVCYHSILPNFIIPHKHYNCGVIGSVIAAAEARWIVEQSCICAADISTMRRWIRQFKVRGAVAVGWLLSILFEVFNTHIRAFELHKKKLLEQLSRLLREFKNIGGGSVLGTVNIILTTRNCGFL